MSEGVKTGRNKLTFKVMLDGWKLSRRSGKSVTKKDEEQLRERIEHEFHSQCGAPPVTEGCVGLRLRFYNVPARWDPDNLAKPIMDDLRNLAFKDDNQVVELHVRQFKGSGKPRVEIEVLKCNELLGWFADYLAELSAEDIVRLLKERFRSKPERQTLLRAIRSSPRRSP